MTPEEKQLNKIAQEDGRNASSILSGAKEALSTAINTPRIPGLPSSVNSLLAAGNVIRQNSNLDETLGNIASKGAEFLPAIGESISEGAKRTFSKENITESIKELPNTVNQGNIDSGLQAAGGVISDVGKSVVQETALAAAQFGNEVFARGASGLFDVASAVGNFNRDVFPDKREIIENGINNLERFNQTSVGDFFLPERSNNQYKSITTISEDASQFAEDFGGDKTTQAIFAVGSVGVKFAADIGTGPITKSSSSITKGFLSQLKNLRLRQIVKSTDDVAIDSFISKNFKDIPDESRSSLRDIIRESGSVKEVEDRVSRQIAEIDSGELVKKSGQIQRSGGRVDDVIESARKEQFAANKLDDAQERFDNKAELEQSKARQKETSKKLSENKKKVDDNKKRIKELNKKKTQLEQKAKAGKPNAQSRKAQQELSEVNKSIKDTNAELKTNNQILKKLEREIKDISDDVNKFRNKSNTSKLVEFGKETAEQTNKIGRKRILFAKRTRLRNRIQELTDLHDLGDISKEAFENKTETLVRQINETENQISNIKITPKPQGTFVRGKAVTTSATKTKRSKLFGFTGKDGKLKKDIGFEFAGRRFDTNVIDDQKPIINAQRGEEFISDKTNAAGRVTLKESKKANLKLESETIQKDFGNMINRVYGDNAKSVVSDLEALILNKRALELIKLKGDNGIGITKKQAESFIKKITEKYAGDGVFNNAENIIKNINKKQLTEAYQDGFINRELFLKILDEQPNYAPLFNKSGQLVFDVDTELKSISSTIDAFKKGSGEIENVIDSTFIKYNKSIDTGVENEARKAWGEFILNSKQDFILNSTDDAGKKLFNVKEIPVDSFPKDGITYFDDGKKFLISSPNNYIAPFAKKVSTNIVATGLNKIVNFQSKILTTFSASFQAKSFIRDGIESMTISNSLLNDVKSNTLGLFGNARSESVNVFKGFRDIDRGVDSVNARYLNEFLFEAGAISGGKTTTLSFGDSSKFSDIINNKGVGKIEQFQNASREISKRLEVNARAAAYIDARKGGLSVIEAGAIAQEVGTNFTKKGWLTQMAQPLYMFFNASVQGNAATFRAWKRAPLEFAKAQAAVATTVGVEEAVNQSIAGEDWRDLIPEHVLTTNAVFIVNIDDEGSANYIKIPLPHILAPSKVLFNNSSKVVSGKMGAGAAIEQVLKTSADALSPVGGGPLNTIGEAGSDETDVLKQTGITFAPDAIAPIVELTFNTDNFGNDIYKYEPVKELDEFGNVSEKNVLKGDRFEDNDNAVKRFANYLSGLLSGEDEKGRSFLNNEATIFHLLRGYGINGDIMTGINTVDDVFSGDLSVSDAPISKSFIGKTEKGTGTAGFAKLKEVESLISVAETEQEKKEIYAESLATGGFSSTEINSQLGFTFEDVTIGSTANGAMVFKALSTITDDPQFEAERVATIQSLRDAYQEDPTSIDAQKYKNYVMHLAGSDGMYAEQPENIIRYFNDNGITLDTNSNGSIKKADLRSMYESQFAQARINFPNVEKKIRTTKSETKLLDTPQNLESLIKFQGEINELAELGFIHPEEAKDIVNSRVNKAHKNNQELFTSILRSGTDSNELLTRVRLEYSQKDYDWLQDFIINNGY